jgi:hypothetical protein
MPNNTISINTVLFGAGQPRKGPSNIERDLEGFGLEERAPTAELVQIIDGSSSLKWKWTLTWNNVPAATRSAVEAIAQLLVSFPFVDQDGIAYTVMCPLSGRYRDGIGINGKDNTTVYYGVTLVFEQV